MEVLPERSEDDKLPSADFATAGCITLLFFFSMCFFVKLFPFEFSFAQAQAGIFFASEKESPGENEALALDMPSPPSYKLLAPPIIEKNPEIPVIEIPVFKGKKGEKDYHPIINKTARRNDIEPALIKAIVMAESGFDPRAVSERGAAGLMQLMPETAESLGVVNRFNPEQNIRGGVKYFKQLIEKLNGDIELALAAYNAGLGPVLKYKGIPPYEATQYYVRKVLRYYEHYKKQEETQAGLDRKNGRDSKHSEKVEEA